MIYQYETTDKYGGVETHTVKDWWFDKTDYMQEHAGKAVQLLVGEVTFEFSPAEWLEVLQCLIAGAKAKSAFMPLRDFATVSETAKQIV